MQTRMIYKNMLLVLLVLLTAVGCGITEDNLEESVSQTSADVITPTGYPSGEIQRGCIMYNEKVYLDQFERKATLPEGYSMVGEIEGVDNVNGPVENFQGARVEIGQEIYASEDGETLYLKEESKYRKYRVFNIEYPSGEVQRGCIMYNEMVYLDQFEPKVTLPEGYSLVGEIESVDNVNGPAENFQGARVEIGQEIYVSEDGETLYLKEESNYRLFKGICKVE